MKPTISAIARFSIAVLAAAGLAVAQDQMPQTQPHQWRTFDQAQAAPVPGDPQLAAPAPDQSGPQNFATQAPPDQNPNVPNPVTPLDQAQAPGAIPAVPAQPPQGFYPPLASSVPAHLTIKPGTYVTVRINQFLSSDRNQTGDAFAATLAQPLVVDGVVVAQRGQTIGGRVSEAQKAGRVEGTSRLGLQLTDLTLADGANVPIQSQMINRNGPTSVGRDAAAIGGTTALGAAIGAGVGWGTGAAIGAGAGAAAGILGVLLTRGRPTVVYPETVMTFRIDSPIDVATDRAPQAFRYASQQDYGTGYGPAPGPRPTYGYGPAPYAYGPTPAPVAPYPYYGYAPYPYPYYYPGFSVYVGPGFGYYRWRR